MTTRSYRLGRTTRFAVELGRLVRTVVNGDGRRYVHRCDKAALEEVAHVIADCADVGITSGGLWKALPDVPATQISVALDFLKDRGIVDVVCRRCVPASDTVYEDAMIEFHVLAEGDTCDG